MSIIRMKRSEALEWVKLGIQRGNYQAALDILNSLIEQERKVEEEESAKPRHLDN